MNTVSNINNLSINISNKDLNLRVGDRVSINILKAISNELYLINIKGKLLNAVFKTQPTLSKYTGIVFSTEPFLEIKLEKNETDSINLLKKFLVNFDKNLIKNILSRSDLTDLKDLTDKEIKKLIKNFGIEFESKLLKNEDIKDDLKGLFFKSSDSQGIDAITRLQVSTILNQAFFYIFTSERYGIKDGEIIYKKGAKSNHFFIKAHFSELKDVIIFLTQNEGKIDGTIKTAKDISDFINQINLPGISLKWQKLEEEDFKRFDIFKTAISKIGNLQIYA
ncbi:MAG: hypothetical protein JG767_928 [Deferribacteraceae bacterium]|jgi:hypothetical protein|nr:hypothetical protein [Deferribacteraceae bacterium]